MTDPWEAQREALGAFIREQRKRANLSLRQLAELTSLSNPYLSQVERGLHQPSVRVLKALSGALNVSAETLLAQAGLIDAMVPSEALAPHAPLQVIKLADHFRAFYPKWFRKVLIWRNESLQTEQRVISHRHY